MIQIDEGQLSHKIQERLAETILIVLDCKTTSAAVGRWFGAFKEILIYQ